MLLRRPSQSLPGRPEDRKASRLAAQDLIRVVKIREDDKSDLNLGRSLADLNPTYTVQKYRKQLQLLHLIIKPDL
jgi:hypothetical protein